MPQNHDSKLLGEYRSRKDLLVLLVIGLVGIVLSGLAYRTDLKSEEAATRASFEAAVNRGVTFLKDNLEEVESALRSLQDFYYASDEVTRPEFRAFTERILKQNLGLQALEWIPRITNDNLSRFTERARKDGFTNFEITGNDSENRLRKRPAQAEYFPVYYVEPLAGNEPALGFDLASESLRRYAMEASTDSGKITVTEQIRLVQEGGTVSGFLVLLPLYIKDAPVDTVEDRRKNLEGFLLAVFRARDFLSRSFQMFVSEGIKACAYDLESQDSERLVYCGPDGEDSAFNKFTAIDSDHGPILRLDNNFNVWGRKWALVCMPQEGNQTWQIRFKSPLAILVSFLSFTFLLLGYVSFLQSDKAAAKRREEISLKAQRDLENECIARQNALDALSHSYETLDSVFRFAPIPIAFTKDRNILFVNEAFCKLLMYSEEEICDQTTRTFYETDEEFQRLGETVFPQIISKGRTEIETSFVKKDGSRIDILLSLGAINRSDLSAGIVFSFLDFTDRNQTCRKLEENALKLQKSEVEKSEILQRLELALKGADLGVWDWHVQSGDLFQDETWHAQLGYSMDDVERNIASWEDRIHPDDKPAVLKALNDCLDGVSPFYSVEHRLLTKSGDWKWILTRGKVLEHDEQGLPVRMLGTHLDIDNSKRAELDLRKSQKIFRVLTETIDDVFWMSDPTVQNMVYVSPAYEKVWGKALEDLYKDPKAFLESVHSDDIDRFMEYFEKFHHQGKGYSVEYRIIRPDGSIRWIFERAYPIHDENGHLEFMCGVCTDISERKTTEEEYKKFRTISDKSNSGNAISDLNGNILYLNHSFARMHGYSVSECLGRNLSMFHTEEQMPAIKGSMATLVNSGSFETLELWHKRKDETVFPTLMNGASISDDKDNPLFLSVTVIDITEQKKAEQYLRDREELFRKLFYIAPDSMAISRLDDGKYIDINEKFTQLTKFTREDILGRTSLDIGLWVNPHDFQLLEPLAKVFI